jgi:hypothetical protein
MSTASGWTANLLGPLDLQIDGVPVDVPRRQTVNLTGGFDVEDDPTNQRTNLSASGFVAPTGTGVAVVTDGDLDAAASLGTALQVLRTNAGGTAAEWATPASGVTPAGSSGDLQANDGAGALAAVTALKINGSASIDAVLPIIGRVASTSPYGVHGDASQAMASTGTTTVAVAAYTRDAITCTGALAAWCTATFPAPAAGASYEKLIINSCTGANYGINVGIGSGSTVAIPNGRRAKVLFTSAGASLAGSVIKGTSSTQLLLSPVDGALTCSSTAAVNETHGFRFFNYRPMTVAGVRLFSGASGSGKTFKVQLWNAAGTSLANASAVSSANNEDLTILFASPVAIGAMTSATDYYQISTFTSSYCAYLVGAMASNWPASTAAPFIIAPNLLFKTWTYITGDACPTSVITTECYPIEPVFA